ncbi:MAG: hypothetical protein ACR2IV_03690 [Bryobacteraceae bacterium]
MSAATMDRLLKPVRDVAKQGHRRTSLNTTLRQSIVVRTFNDWNDPPPGYFEMDMVAHCGKSVAGSHVHSLVLTDIASGWTGQLRTLQRRVKHWRTEVARRLVLGSRFESTDSVHVVVEEEITRPQLHIGQQ